MSKKENEPGLELIISKGPIGVCAQGFNKIRKVVIGVKSAPSPEAAWLRMRAVFPTGEDIQGRLEEIITEAIADKFFGPKL